MFQNLAFYLLVLFCISFSRLATGQSTVNPTGSNSRQYIDQIDPILAWVNDIQSNAASVKELELLDYQVKEFEQLSKQRMELMQKEANALGPSMTNGDQKKFGEKFRQKLIDDTQEVLLPHQLEKLQHLMVMDVKRQMGTAGLLSMKWFYVRLGIPESDMERIQARAEKEKAKLDEIVAKARKQAEENILSEFSDEQREKVLKLIGDASK